MTVNLEGAARNALISAAPYAPFAADGGGAGGDLSFSGLLEKAKQAAAGELPVKAVPAPGRLDTASLSGEDRKLYEACLELETFLVKNMLGGMRKTVLKSELTGVGFAGEMYEDMLWDEYAKAYTRSASFGLAEMAYTELNGRRSAGV